MTNPSKKKTVLFLCTGNSARTQMAEGFTGHFGKGMLEVYSAGLEPKGIHPMAITVMDEAGIDIRKQRSKKIDPVLLEKVDCIITVCANAEEHCPVTSPRIQRLHWPLEDPAQACGTEDQNLDVFRKTRDEIRERVQRFLRETTL